MRLIPACPLVIRRRPGAFTGARLFPPRGPAAAKPRVPDSAAPAAVGRPGETDAVVLTHSGVGDRSLGDSVNQGGLSISVLAFLKGAVYVGIVAKPGPGAAAMKPIAMTALGRV